MIPFIIEPFQTATFSETSAKAFDREVTKPRNEYKNMKYGFKKINHSAIRYNTIDYATHSSSLGRTCMKDTTVCGYHIEEVRFCLKSSGYNHKIFAFQGTIVQADPHAVNLSKELWGEDAEEFRPERWELMWFVTKSHYFQQYLWVWLLSMSGRGRSRHRIVDEGWYISDGWRQTIRERQRLFSVSELAPEFASEWG